MKHAVRIAVIGLAAGATLLLASSVAAQSGPPPFVPILAPAEPDAIPLYPHGAPRLPGAAAQESWGTYDKYFKVVRNVSVPTITPYLPHPSHATGAAVIVVPGGGFTMLAIDAEGTMVARYLAEHGVAAFVLKYRVNPTPADQAAYEAASARANAAAASRDMAAGPPPVFQPALDDGVAAMRFVRAYAAEYGVDPHRVGMIGFSAGAMMTLSVAMARAAGASPDFIGLIYGPMAPATVPADAPPLFAALASDDPLFGRMGFGLIDSWLQAQRPVEFHLYQSGSHGFGMRPVGTTATLWPDEFLAWMRANNFLAHKSN